MQRVVIIGDSNAMPRPAIRYEQTWPYLLYRKHPEFEFINFSKRGSISNRLISEGGGYREVASGADLLEHYEPNISIIQLGIVDCSPRLINPNGLTYKIINNLSHKLKSLCYKLLKKYRKRSASKVFVSAEKFQFNFEDYIIRARSINCKVIIIMIAEAGQLFLSKNPEIGSNIKKYNSILNTLGEKYENVYILKPFYNEEEVESCLLDEYHYNSKGHKIIFEKISAFLKGSSSTWITYE